ATGQVAPWPCDSCDEGTAVRSSEVSACEISAESRGHMANTPLGVREENGQQPWQGKADEMSRARSKRGLFPRLLRARLISSACHLVNSSTRRKTRSRLPPRILWICSLV